MSVICIDALQDPRWDKFVREHECNVFYSPRWLQVLHGTYGFDVNAYLLLDERGEPIAGLPFVPIDDLSGRRLVSLPFSDFCDPVVSNLTDWQRLTAPIIDAQQPFIVRCVHNEVPLSDERLELTNRAKWHGIDLRRDITEIRRSLHSSAKNKINRALRHELTVEVAEHKEQMRDFYNLHLRTRKYKYHYLAQPYCFFENIWHRIIEPGHGVLLMAMYKGNVAGSSIGLFWQDTFFYKFTCSLPEYQKYGPSDLLVWQAINDAKARGYQYYDYGLSDWDQESLVWFKRKFATDEKTISMLRYTPTGTPSPQQNQFRALLPQLTDLFTDEAVPDTITEKAGALLYRYFC